MSAVSDIAVALQRTHLTDGPHTAPQGVTKTPLVLSLLSCQKEQSITSLYEKKQANKQCLLIYKLAKQALEQMERMNLEHFEPLVRDCACQLRALFSVQHIRKLKHDSSLQTEYRSLKQVLSVKIGALQKQNCVIQQQIEKAERQSFTEQRTQITPTPFANLLTAEGLDIEVSSEVMTTIQMHLLTRTRSLGKTKATCSDCGKEVASVQETTQVAKLLSVQNDIPLGVLASLVKDAQKSLAAASCAFIRKEAEELKMGELTQLLLSSENRVQVHERDEVPCLASIDTMLESCRQRHIPILLRVRKAAHTVESIDEVGKYDVALLILTQGSDARLVFREPSKEDMNQPVIFIEGQRSGKAIEQESTAEYKARLVKEDPSELIHLNAAAHSPYSNSSVVMPLAEKVKSTIEPLVIRAKGLGCIRESQTLLSITHIFCQIMNPKLVECS